MSAMGYIQWKGTDVCMEVHCACGYQSHIDADFLYFVRCPECKKVWKLSPWVALEEPSPEDEIEKQTVLEADP